MDQGCWLEIATDCFPRGIDVLELWYSLFQMNRAPHRSMRFNEDRNTIRVYSLRDCNFFSFAAGESMMGDKKVGGVVRG